MDYRKEIIATLIKGGDYYVEDSYKHYSPLTEDCEWAMVRMSYIPELNQRIMLNNMNTLISDTAGRGSFADFLSAAAKRGLLSFEPYIGTTPFGTPTLVLKYNRFVHMFRDQDYRVFYTPDLVGVYQSASYRIDFIRKGFSEIYDSYLLKCLYYMNLINACSGIDNFDKTLTNNPDLIDEFMRLSTKEIYNGKFDLKYIDMVSNMVSSVWENTSLEPIARYRIAASDTMDFARVNVYSNDLVGVEVISNMGYPVEISVRAPEWYHRNRKALDEYMYAWDCDEDTVNYSFNKHIYENGYVFGSLVAFALNYVGMVAGCNHIHPIRVDNTRTMKALNDSSVITLSSLNLLHINDDGKPSKALSLLDTIAKMSK